MERNGRKDRKRFFLQKLKWNFSRNYRPHPIHQSQCFFNCRKMLSVMPIISVQCRPHRWKFPKLHIHFIHCDHYFRNKPARCFRLDVSIHTFSLWKSSQNDKLGLIFVHWNPFCLKKSKQWGEIRFFSKSREFFLKRTCCISLLFSPFPCKNLPNWQTLDLVVHMGNFIDGNCQKINFVCVVWKSSQNF